MTDRIIAAIAAGTPPGRKPWTGDRRRAAFPLRACGEPCRGINVILLWLETDAKGYASPLWFTCRQAQELFVTAVGGKAAGETGPIAFAEALEHRLALAGERDHVHQFVLRSAEVPPQAGPDPVLS